MNAGSPDAPASEGQVTAEQAAAQPAAPPAGRPIRRIFTGFDLGSVFKFGSAFYLSLAAAWLVGALLLFFAAKTTGIVANIEGFVRESGFEGFRMTWLGVFRVLFLTGALAAVTLTVLTLLSAFLFNKVADVFGGIEMRMVQDEAESQEQQGAPPA